MILQTYCSNSDLGLNSFWNHKQVLRLLYNQNGPFFLKIVDFDKNMEGGGDPILMCFFWSWLHACSIFIWVPDSHYQTLLRSYPPDKVWWRGQNWSFWLGKYITSCRNLIATISVGWKSAVPIAIWSQHTLFRLLYTLTPIYIKILHSKVYGVAIIQSVLRPSRMSCM